MPYIKLEERQKFNDLFVRLPAFDSKGELEYCIYKLMKHFMSTRKTEYATLHDCVYASQHCADEFRRRYLDKREDEALEKNGEI